MPMGPITIAAVNPRSFTMTLLNVHTILATSRSYTLIVDLHGHCRRNAGLFSSTGGGIVLIIFVKESFLGRDDPSGRHGGVGANSL